MRLWSLDGSRTYPSDFVRRPQTQQQRRDHGIVWRPTRDGDANFCLLHKSPWRAHQVKLAEHVDRSNCESPNNSTHSVRSLLLNLFTEEACLDFESLHARSADRFHKHPHREDFKSRVWIPTGAVDDRSSAVPLSAQSTVWRKASLVWKRRSRSYEYETRRTPIRTSQLGSLAAQVLAEWWVCIHPSTHSICSEHSDGRLHAWPRNPKQRFRNVA